MEFVEYYHKNEHKIRLVDKKKSWFMKTINFFLLLAGKLGIAAIQDFLTRYVTTIAHSIYASPAWTWQKKVSPLIVHELCHVYMWGLWYGLRYVVSKKYRILVESTCAQAEMLCFPERYMEGDLERKAQHYVPYGIPHDMCVKAIRDRYQEMQNGKPQPAAKRIHTLFTTWRNSYPQQV